MRILVAGGGGFIGGYLVEHLLGQGHHVTAADIKPIENWWQVHEAANNLAGRDLRLWQNAMEACRRQDHVYNLACDMGGIGYIEGNKAVCMLSVLINTHLLMASHRYGVKRYFYTSSACVYAADKQDQAEQPALKEADAYPAMPEDGYGWEKLFSERMCRHFTEDYGLETRVARLHNVMGPKGSWCDGREKAPAAICRKVANAKLQGFGGIEVWGDGTRTRSYCWVGDCIEGIRLLMDSTIQEPLNIGSRESVTVDRLIELVEEIAGVKLLRSYDTSKPQGVMGRNSDNTKIKTLLNWEPTTALRTSLEKTYPWILDQVREALEREKAQ